LRWISSALSNAARGRARRARCVSESRPGARVDSRSLGRSGRLVAASRALGWLAILPALRGGSRRAVRCSAEQERHIRRQGSREPPAGAALALHFKRSGHLQPSVRAVFSPRLPLDRSLRNPDEGWIMLIAHAVGPHGRIKRAYVCRGARGRYANLGAEGDPLFDLALIVVPAHQEIPARHEEDG
jgi:hypothetical protein